MHLCSSCVTWQHDDKFRDPQQTHKRESSSVATYTYKNKDMSGSTKEGKLIKGTVMRDRYMTQSQYNTAMHITHQWWAQICPHIPTLLCEIVYSFSKFQKIL